jgi:DNA polymerase III gamma/tau subunit
MRQAIANLEKCLAYNTEIHMDTVCTALGSGNYDIMTQFITNVINYETSSALACLETFYQEGKDPKTFIYDCLRYCLDIQKVKLNSGNLQYSALPELASVQSLLSFDSNLIIWMIESLSNLYEDIKYDNTPMPLIEISILKYYQKKSCITQTTSLFSSFGLYFDKN